MAYADVILADRPTAYWALNAIPSTDLTGNGHTLTHDTAAGGTVSISPGALPGTEQQGCLLNHNGGRMVTPHAADMARTIYSVEFWVMPTASDGTFRIVVAKGNGALPGGRNPAFWLTPSEMAIHYTQETSTPAAGQVVIGSSTIKLTAEAWNHVVGTCSGSELRLYINGALSDVVAAGTSVMTTNTAPFYVGNSSAANTVGQTDEVAYYPYVLSAEQVLAHYEMGLTSGVTGAVRSVMNSKPRLFYANEMDTRWWTDTTRNQGRLDFGIPGSDPWSMTQGANLAMWLDPGQTTHPSNVFPNLTAGQTFPDVGANAFSGTPVVPLVAGQGPIYRTGGINGRPYLEQSSSPNRALHWPVNYTGQEHTIFMVARKRTVTASRIFSSKNNNWLAGWWSTSEDQFHWDGWIHQPAVAGTTLLRTYTGMFIPTSGTSRNIGWKNGVEIFRNGTSSNGFNGLITSGYQGTSELSDADIYEIIVYNRSMTEAEVKNIHGYLANKYGTWVESRGGFTHTMSLTSGHPVIDGNDNRYLELGRGDYGTLPDYPQVRITGPLTIEFWIYPTALDVRQNVVQKSSYYHEFSTTLEPTGEMSFYWGNGGSGTYNAMNTGAGTIPVNTWTHVALRRGATAATSAVFINGRKIKEGAAAVDVSTGGTVATGGTFYQAALGNGPFTVGYGYLGDGGLLKGRLANLALFAREVPDAEIAAHYRTSVSRTGGLGYGGYGG